MRKLIFLFILLCIFSQLKTYADTVSSIVSADGSVSYNITHSEKYYCPDNPNEKGMFDERFIYSPKDDCSIWQNSFWKNTGKDFYQICLDRQKYMQGIVNSDKCDRITVEKFEKDGAVCEFEVTKQFKKIVRTTCINGNLNSMKKEFMKINGYE